MRSRYGESLPPRHSLSSPKPRILRWSPTARCVTRSHENSTIWQRRPARLGARPGHPHPRAIERRPGPASTRKHSCRACPGRSAGYSAGDRPPHSRRPCVRSPITASAPNHPFACAIRSSIELLHHSLAPISRSAPFDRIGAYCAPRWRSSVAGDSS